MQNFRLSGSYAVRGSDQYRMVLISDGSLVKVSQCDTIVLEPLTVAHWTDLVTLDLSQTISSVSS